MFMYIVCVCVCFVAFCFSVILAVSCSSSKQKKNEKKNIVALTQYSRARIFPHTLFDFKKLQVSRQDLYISPYKKLSLLAGASRHPCHLSRVPLSLLPERNLCLSVCLKHSDWPAIETHCRNRRERGRFRFLCFQRFSPFSPPTRWWSPVVAGGDTRSTLSSFKAAPDPVIVCVWGEGVAKSPLFLLAAQQQFTNRSRFEHENCVVLGFCLLFNASSLYRATADSIPGGGTREQRRFGWWWWSSSSSTLRSSPSIW